MSTQSCTPTSPLYCPPYSTVRAAPEPALAVLEAAQAPGQSWLGRIWGAYRKWRSEARMRNLAAQMDAHQLQDVGAPQWLVNEATVKRDLERLRNADYLRW
ncbi:hypothetical protein ABE485_16190 [Achromobacter spanius]|uniref:hypothetical protein n=1 Tax=Achromobacter spanius TaxID=217203 RepID=UPI00320AD733